MLAYMGLCPCTPAIVLCSIIEREVMKVFSLLTKRYRMWRSLFCVLASGFGYVNGAWAEGSQGDPRLQGWIDQGLALQRAIEPFVAEHTALLLGVVLVLAVLLGLLRRRHRLLARMAESARLAQQSGRRRSTAQAVATSSTPTPTPFPAALAESSPVGPYVMRLVQGDDSRLPETPPWVGRQNALVMLDAAWAEPQVVVAAVVGADGMGKSRLMHHWADRCGAKAALRRFFWSFSVPTESRLGSELFFRRALAFFAPEGEAVAAQPAEWPAQLCSFLTMQPALLLLDGVEWLQSAGEGGGYCRDPDLQKFFRLLADGLPAWPHGLVLLTARQSVIELAGVEGGLYRCCALDPLKENEAMQLLHGFGIRGRFADFRPLVKGMQAHPLLLTLLGRLISRYYQGSMTHQARFAELLQPAAIEQVLERLLSHYELVIWSGDPAYALVLRLLGLCDQPVTRAVLEGICREVALHPLSELETDHWQDLWLELQQAGLLEPLPGVGGESWQLHPLVRAYYARQWDGEDHQRCLQLRQAIAQHVVQP